MGLRFLLYLILVFVLYRLIKTMANNSSFDFKNGRDRASIRQKGHPGHIHIDDELVKDPACGVYVAKREAIQIRIGDKEYFFCSKSCKEKFLSQHN